MKSFLEVAAHVLEQHGPMEITRLVDAALRVKHLTRPRFMLGHDLYRLAASHQMVSPQLSIPLSR